MNKEVFKYLSEYSYDPYTIDRLIVSTFLHSNKKSKVRNKFIDSLLIKPNEGDFINLQNFLQIAKIESFEDLIKVFEFVVSPENKIVNGAVYTPKRIREYIIDSVFEKSKLSDSLKIGDIACGCGGFLLTAAKKLHRLLKCSYSDIFRSNLYGLDIEQFSIERSKILLSLLAIMNDEDILSFEFNLFVGNALNFSWQDQASLSGFDIIVGNPPYVCSRNMEPETKNLLSQWIVSASGHPDLYIPFFQIGIENLCTTGILGYITVNTFFKSINGRAIRHYFKTKRFDLEIIDFGGEQVFESKSTYTCICFIENKSNNEVKYRIADSKKLSEKATFQIIPWDKLNSKKGWNLNSHELIEKIESVGIPFKEIYKATSGIATLKNHIYIFDPIDEDSDFFYLQNGEVYPIEKSICVDIINPNRFTKVVDPKEIRQKVIFPYKYFNGSKAPNIIPEKTFKQEFPKAFKYLDNKATELACRDKGQGKYEEWYAYGRRQSLEKYDYKLFFPHISNKIPNYVFSQERDLLFYNGKAVVSNNKEELLVLQKILQSNLFWEYIKLTSKPYSHGFFSLSSNYLGNFGIPILTTDEKNNLLTLKKGAGLDTYVSYLYSRSDKKKTKALRLFD